MTYLLTQLSLYAVDEIIPSANQMAAGAVQADYEIRVVPNLLDPIAGCIR